MGSNILDDLLNENPEYVIAIAKLAIYDYLAKNTTGLLSDMSELHRKLRQALNILGPSSISYNNENIGQLMNNRSVANYFFKMNNLDSKDVINYEKILSIVANLTSLVLLKVDPDSLPAYSNDKILIMPPQVIFSSKANLLRIRNFKTIKYETSARTTVAIPFPRSLIVYDTSGFRDTLFDSIDYERLLNSSIADLSYNAIANYNENFSNYNSKFKNYYMKNVFNFVKTPASTPANVSSVLDAPNIAGDASLLSETYHYDNITSRNHFVKGDNEASLIFKTLYNANFVFEKERDTSSDIFKNTDRTLSNRPPASAADYLIYKRIKDFENSQEVQNYAKKFYNNTVNVVENLSHTLGLNFDNDGKTLVPEILNEDFNVNPLSYFNYFLKSIAVGIEKTYTNLHEPFKSLYENNTSLRSRISYSIFNLITMHDKKTYQSFLFNNCFKGVIDAMPDDRINSNDKLALKSFFDKANNNLVDLLKEEYERQYDIALELSKESKDPPGGGFSILGYVDELIGAVVEAAGVPQEEEKYKYLSTGDFILDNDVVNRNYTFTSEKLILRKDILDDEINLVSPVMTQMILGGMFADAAFQKEENFTELRFSSDMESHDLKVENDSPFNSIDFVKTGLGTLRDPYVAKIKFGKYNGLIDLNHLQHTFMFYNYFCRLFKKCIRIPVIRGSANPFGANKDTFKIGVDRMQLLLFSKALKNSEYSRENYEASMPYEDFKISMLGDNASAIPGNIMSTLYDMYYKYFKAVCREVNKVKDKIKNRRDGILEGLNSLLQPALKLFDFEKTYEKFFGIDDEPKYSKFLITHLQRNKMLETISANSSFQKSAVFLNYINNFAITKNSFPYTKSDSTSLVEQKVMFRYLTRKGYGYLNDEKTTENSILHVGLTNGMLDNLRSGDVANLIAIKIDRINHLNQDEKTIPNYYIFDTSKYFMQCYFDENFKVKENLIFRQYADNIPMSALIARAQFFKFKDSRLVLAGTGKEAFGTERSEDALSNFYKSAGTDYTDEFKKSIIENHLTDYFLKLYTKSTLGIDIRDSSFNLVKENNFYGNLPNSNTEKKLYSKINSYVHDNIFSQDENPKEFARHKNFLKNWSFLGSQPRFDDVASFKCFDRTFSILLNPRDFLFDPTFDEENSNNSSYPNNLNLGMFFNNSTYRLNGKLHTQTNPLLNSILGLNETEDNYEKYVQYVNEINSIYGYVITINLLKRW